MSFTKTISSTYKSIGRYYRPFLIFSVVYSILVSYRWILQPDWIFQSSDEMIELFNLIELVGGGALILLFIMGFFKEAWDKASITKRVKKTLPEIQALSPSEFEEYVADLFRAKGYRAILRGKSGDKGVDVEVFKKGRKAVVQCKRYSSSVSPEVVRELYGTSMHEKADHAFLVASAGIGVGGYTWAKGKPMTLIDGKTLAKLANHANEKIDW